MNETSTVLVQGYTTDGDYLALNVDGSSTVFAVDGDPIGKISKITWGYLLDGETGAVVKNKRVHVGYFRLCWPGTPATYHTTAWGSAHGLV